LGGSLRCKRDIKKGPAERENRGVVRLDRQTQEGRYAVTRGRNGHKEKDWDGKDCPREAKEEIAACGGATMQVTGKKGTRLRRVEGRRSSSRNR